MRNLLVRILAVLDEVWSAVIDNRQRSVDRRSSPRRAVVASKCWGVTGFAGQGSGRGQPRFASSTPAS